MGGGGGIGGGGGSQRLLCLNPTTVMVVLLLGYIYISKRYLKVCYKLIFRPLYIIRSLVSSAANHKNIGMLTKTHVFNSLLKADNVSLCFTCSRI